MLKLDGTNAIVMLVAKNGLPDIKVGIMQQLQTAVAVYAGLRSPSDVRSGDVLQMVADLHDTLSTHGLLKHGARNMLEVLRYSRLSANQRSDSIDPANLLLSGWMSNITTTQIRRDGVELIEWESSIPTGFADEFVGMGNLETA